MTLLDRTNFETNYFYSCQFGGVSVMTCLLIDAAETNVLISPCHSHQGAVKISASKLKYRQVYKCEIEAA